MRTIAISVALAAACLLPGAAGADETPPVTTVDSVDLARYVGTWHEIAKIPNRFQDHCVRGTTAQYRLREDGRIEVINSCYDEDGELDRAEGVAKIEDRKGNARLKVSFVSFLGWRPFWGDYWILGLDDGYGWAVVGTPDRKYGWILARTPTLDEATLAEAFGVLERNGYDPAVFEMSAP